MPDPISFTTYINSPGSKQASVIVRIRDAEMLTYLDDCTYWMAYALYYSALATDTFPDSAVLPFCDGWGFEYARKEVSGGEPLVRLILGKPRGRKAPSLDTLSAWVNNHYPDIKRRVIALAKFNAEQKAEDEAAALAAKNVKRREDLVRRLTQTVLTVARERASIAIDLPGLLNMVREEMQKAALAFLDGEDGRVGAETVLGYVANNPHIFDVSDGWLTPEVAADLAAQVSTAAHEPENIQRAAGIATIAPTMFL